MGVSLRKPVQPASVFILEIGIAASIAMMGAMLVLLTLVTPADRTGSPLIVSAVERLEGLSHPRELIRTSTRAGTIVDTTSELPFGTPWPPRFIVSISSHSDAAGFLRTFRENRGAARARFAEWAATEPTFQGFHLEGLTTSGDAVLSYREAGETSPSDELETRLMERLNASPDVRHTTPFRGARAVR